MKEATQGDSRTKRITGYMQLYSDATCPILAQAGTKNHCAIVSGNLVNDFSASRRKSDGGFSLLELMVVVVVISTLALAILPRVMDRPDQARVARARQDVAVLDSALLMYRLDNLHLPSTAQGLPALVERPTDAPEPPNWTSPYVQRLPADPWGRPYHYLHPGLQGEFDVFSYGADGVPGGSGPNEDIGNWGPSK